MRDEDGTTTINVNKVNAEAAVRTLLAYTGDDPNREGLRETPERVVRAFGEWFAGYKVNAAAILSKTFEEVGGYDEIVVLRDIRLESFCEHHMAPIIGKVHIGYLPGERIVGLSKLARVAEAFAKRLQVQERLTAEIADTIELSLRPRGVAVVVEASHLCTATRGIHKSSSVMVTSAMRGIFRDDAAARSEVLSLLGVR